MPKKKYLISQLVYGDLYLKIFLDRHLKSVLDDANLPRVKDQVDIEYRIYTDTTTQEKLKTHPMIKRLAAYANVEIVVFEWDNTPDKFGARYPLLMMVFKATVDYALEKNFDYVTAWVADLVVAKDFFSRILSRMDEHDAVFVLPLRAAFESTAGAFGQINGALLDVNLFNLGYQHLHPLWIACHWGSKRFTRMPYTLLWSSGRGLLARSFSVTPIIFKPQKEMLNTNGMIDGDIPQFFKNPFWCEDWLDAPVMGVEPLFCHYPPFSTAKSSVPFIRRWAYRRESPPIHPTQRPLLKKRLYYPSRKYAGVSWWMRLKSDIITFLVG